MLDIKFIRNNEDEIRKTLTNKGIKDVSLDEFLEIDNSRGDLLRRIEQHRSLRNQLSSDVSKVKKGADRNKLVEEARKVKEELHEMETEFTELDEKHKELLMKIPNVPSREMPVGKGEEDNVVLKVWVPERGYLDLGSNTQYSDVSYMEETKFPYKDHVELGELLDVIDVKQSAVVSGSRFSYLKNEAVLLQDAIFSYLKSRLRSMGYVPMIPPILVRENALFGTSHFPEGKADAYKIENFNVEDKNELYLVGSSEPANFSYFTDKVFEKRELPVKLFAQTTCFRSEVGSWGKDVRGIKRVHQFDKLEMNALCLPEESRSIFDEFLETNEWMLQQLKLPYRIVNKCTGDCGYNASYLQYDFEYWCPGEREFIEGGTNTITTDYQARRLNIKYKDAQKTNFVHTVNDTGCAMPRMLISILENYQTEDGSVVIPEILREFVGLEKILPKLDS
ncbi:serine--tRNA ligase [Patescibacteria group bacterium]|nr:serine--tRNA ligase [Patescibacteria group bacterium]